MTHSKPRRKATPAQARFLENRRRWTRIRLNAWKTMPEKMEAIRREATKMAARRKDEKNDLIRRVANYWPEDMTTSELRERIALDLDYRGKVSSLIYRMRRNGLLEFKVDGRWHNLCRLPRSKPSAQLDANDEGST